MKILLLNNSNHNSIGGIETYINNLLDLNIFDVNDIIDEIYIYHRGDDNKKNNRLNKSELFDDNNFNYDEIINYYDIVIVNCTWTVREKINLKKILSNDKVILVQHSNPLFYTKSFFTNKLDLIDNGIKKFIENLFFKKNKYWISKNIFKYSKNVVFFTKYDHEKIKGEYNFYSYILPTTTHKTIELNDIDKKNKDFIHISRCSSEKNIGYIEDTFLDNNIDIIGNDVKIQEKKNIKYLGKMENSKINNILKEYKYLFLSSRFEGFPIVVTESLAKGLLIISNKSFQGWKIFPLELQQFFWNNKKELLRIIYKLNYENFYKNSIEAINFFNDKFSNNDFVYKWKKIIDDVFNHNK